MWLSEQKESQAGSGQKQGAVIESPIFFKQGLVKTNKIRRLCMSVVIIGGNECMVCQYEKICKDYGCKAKVFAKERSSFKKKLGNPDLMILFTNTVSHKMVNCAVTEAKRSKIQIARTHSSSIAALTSVLETYCG